MTEQTVETTEIYSNTRGRGLAFYPLLERVQELIPGAQQAHATIWATIDELDALGEHVIIDTRPVRQELAGDNPLDRDVDQWCTITTATADVIAEAIAAAAAHLTGEADPDE